MRAHFKTSWDAMSFMSSNMSLRWRGPKAGTSTRCATSQLCSPCQAVKRPSCMPALSSWSAAPRVLVNLFSSQHSLSSATVFTSVLNLTASVSPALAEIKCLCFNPAGSAKSDELCQALYNTVWGIDTNKCCRWMQLASYDDLVSPAVQVQAGQGTDHYAHGVRI